MNGAQRNPNAYVHLRKIVLLVVEVEEMWMYMDVGHQLAIPGVSPKAAAFVALMMKIVLRILLDDNNVVEAVQLRMIVPVLLEFGDTGHAWCGAECNGGRCHPKYQDCKRNSDCDRTKAVCGKQGYCVGK